MRRIILVVSALALGVVGCRSLTYQDGLKCGMGSSCPPGQSCGTDNLCHAPNAAVGSGSGGTPGGPFGDGSIDRPPSDGNIGSGGDGGAVDAPDGRCVPAACVPGENCGTMLDGCGATVQCGACAASRSCGGGGPKPGRPATCSPRPGSARG